GTVVTGTLTGGTVDVDDDLVLLPSGRPVRVRALQTHQQARERAEPGSRVAANLSGVSHDRVARGDALVRPGQWRAKSGFETSLREVAGLDPEVSRRGGPR